MTDRVHYHPNLILSVGTQVVTLVDIPGSAGLVLHPRGTVAVVVKSPADHEHSYRVRFLDGFHRCAVSENWDWPIHPVLPVRSQHSGDFFPHFGNLSQPLLLHCTAPACAAGGAQVGKHFLRRLDLA